MSALELPETFSVDGFWAQADDLLYTRLFYDENAGTYFSRRIASDIAEVTRTLRDFGGHCEDLGGAEDLKECTQEEINTLLVSYLTLVTKYADCAQDQDSFFTLVADYLLQYRYYRLHYDFCLRKMLSLLSFTVKNNLHNLELDVDSLSQEVKNEVNDNINMNECFIKIIGYILFAHHTKYPDELLQCLKDYHGFETLWLVIQNYSAITRAVCHDAGAANTKNNDNENTNNGDGDQFGLDYRNYFLIFFDFAYHSEFSQDQLGSIDTQTVTEIVKTLKPEDTSDELNYVKFKFLLVLNEQFMTRYGVRDFMATNRVFAAICACEFQRFFEMVIFNFNRIKSETDQILLMKFLYLAFLNDATNRLVYFNDIKVIVDIIIRQLYDIDAARHEHLLNVFIRVVHLMLMSTELRRVSYKRSELRDVLHYLETSDGVMAKTRELAHKCLLGDFFAAPAPVVPPLPHIQHASSMPELSSTKNISPLLPLCLAPAQALAPPPPPPPPRSRAASRNLHRVSTSSSLSSQGSLRSKKGPPPPPPSASTSAAVSLR